MSRPGLYGVGAALAVVAFGDAGLIGGAIALLGGVYIGVHELRRRERRITRREIDDLTFEVAKLTDRLFAMQHLLLEQRAYIYRVATMMIDAGMDVPPPPAPSFDPGEYDK